MTIARDRIPGIQALAQSAQDRPCALGLGFRLLLICP
jgi:hypothetical protein